MNTKSLNGKVVDACKMHTFLVRNLRLCDVEALFRLCVVCRFWFSWHNGFTKASPVGSSLALVLVESAIGLCFVHFGNRTISIFRLDV